MCSCNSLAPATVAAIGGETYEVQDSYLFMGPHILIITTNCMTHSIPRYQLRRSNMGPQTVVWLMEPQIRGIAISGLLHVALGPCCRCQWSDS